MLNCNWQHQEDSDATIACPCNAAQADFAACDLTKGHWLIASHNLAAYSCMLASMLICKSKPSNSADVV